MQVRLLSIIMGKKPNMNYDYVPVSLNPQHLPSVIENWSDSNPWAIFNSSEITYLKRKHRDRKGNPPIFNHTFHSGHFLRFSSKTYKGIPHSKKCKVSLEFSNMQFFPCSVLHRAGSHVYLHLAISQSCSLKKSIYSMTPSISHTHSCFCNMFREKNT